MLARMKNVLRTLLLALLTAWQCHAAYAVDAPAMQFIYNGPESDGDLRYAYHWRVLKAALDATSVQWGTYEMRPATYMNEARQLTEMQSKSGRINTLLLDSTAELQQKLLPVRLPVDKGLLGYRVFLIREADQAQFDRVTSLADLKQFRVGQGEGWSDVQVLKAAGLNVVTGKSYPGLFGMLENGRFDVFSRGVTEVMEELGQFGSKHPKLAIEKTLMLYYPMPVYFWFPRGENGALRAKRIDEGMRIILANGRLNEMFDAEFGEVVTKLNLKHRRLLRIGNPFLPFGPAFADPKWLFNPLQ